ncbi:MAG: glycosyltransferase family 4 protein [Clostridiales bacterium]|jgi:1,2-diacylglycerol 3-alpha-glucosyltransferase|nr:glycosyltransferase family 4 protein [Clostridiales bacterium]
MNVGLFSDTYYPQINGVVTSMRMLERELGKLGHKVFVFTTTDPNITSPHPRIFRLPSMPFYFLPTHRVAFLYPPKLIFRLKKLKLDIVHTQTEFPVGIFGKFVSELCKIPLVHTYHTMYEDYVHYIANGHLITKGVAKQFSRLFCNRARVVVVPAEKAKESLLEYGVTRPIHVIPTGIDLEPFSRGKYSDEELAETRRELGLLPSWPVIVFVGRVAKEKSLDVIIKQMPGLIKRLPDVKLVIVGGGPCVDELTALARESGVEASVIFAGPRPWECIGKYYQIGDVFSTASTSETQGLTYVEAMAAKTPLVVRKDGSTEGMIIHGQTGYYFEKDGEAADRLYYALTHREEARRVAENAYETIQSMSAAEFARRIEALYTSVIENYTVNRRAGKNLFKNIVKVRLKPFRFPSSAGRRK